MYCNLHDSDTENGVSDFPRKESEDHQSLHVVLSKASKRRLSRHNSCLPSLNVCT